MFKNQRPQRPLPLEVENCAYFQIGSYPIWIRIENCLVVEIVSGRTGYDPDEQLRSEAVRVVKEGSRVWEQEVIPYLKDKGITRVVGYPTTRSRAKLYKRFGFSSTDTERWDKQEFHL